MNNLLTTTIITVLIIVIIKLFYENKKLKNKLFNNDKQQIDENKNHIEKVEQHNKVQAIFSDKNEIDLGSSSKNKFLYEADNFGEMKKGVVLDGKTYNYEKE